MKYNVVLIKLFFSLAVSAQSMSGVVQQCNTLVQGLDTYNRRTQVDSLNDLAWSYRKTNPELMFCLSEVSTRIVRSIKYPKGLSDSFSLLGSYYGRTYSYDSAQYYHEQALRIRRELGDTLLWMNSLANLGKNAVQQGKLNLGVQYYVQEARLMEKVTVSNKRRARSYSRLGNLFLNKNQYDSAYIYLHEAKIVDALSSPSITTANINLTLANLKERQGEYESAFLLNRAALDIFKLHEELEYDSSLTYYEKSLSLKSPLRDQDGIAGLHYNMALLHMTKTPSKLEEARKGFSKAADLWALLGDTLELAQARSKLGIVHFFLQEYAKAEQLLRYAFHTLDSLGSLSTSAEAALYLGRVYTQLGQADLAEKYLDYSNTNRRAQDVNLSRSNALEKKALNAAYTSILEKNLNHKADIIEGQLRINRAYISLLILCALLIAVGLFAWWQKRKTHVLKLRHAEIKSKLSTQEAKTMSSVLHAQDKERRRIAQDLHDNIGSLLATVRLHFKSFDEKLEQLKEEGKESYTKANQLLEKACDEVRALAHDMASATLMKFGLAKALEEIRDEIVSSEQIEMELHIIGLEKRFTLEVELTLYRLIQEFIGNILKHAEASHISIQLFQKEAILNILIEDDGIGFDPEKPDSTSGIGLKNAAIRVDKLGGDLEIDSTPEKGTTVNINIPLDEGEEDDHFARR